jgi:KDO2-lipid IV(A) lauroyltransferase
MNPVALGLSHLGVACMKAMASWPLAWIRGLGTFFGHLLYIVAHSRRHVVLTNLALCFPQWSEAERRTMARRTFVCFAQTFLDRSWLWHAPPNVLEKRLRLHGALHELEGHQPTIVFSPHFYGLDAGAVAVCMRVPRPFTGISTPQANPVIDAWINTGRHRLGQVHMYTRMEGAKGNLQSLKAGGVLYLLPDMDFGTEGTVFVPFYGVMASTVTSIHRFARLARAKVISVVPRLTAQGYEVEVMAAWADFPSRDMEADTLRGNRLLESFINRSPEQYFWVHKRFKTRPPGHPPVYD